MSHSRIKIIKENTKLFIYIILPEKCDTLMKAT